MPASMSSQVSNRSVKLNEHGPLVLLVDDAALNLIALNGIVSTFGLSSDEAADGNEAIKLSERRLLSK